MFGYKNLWENGTIRQLGDKGVTLFFVLSGFLITYLLLKEKETTGTINIKYFYMRRILRIWPLYFLIVALALFVFPNIPFFEMPAHQTLKEHFAPMALLALCILPNILLFRFGPLPFASQTWSIGVEEQFYLLWPVLVRFVKKLSMLFVVIIGALFVLQNCQVIFPKLFGNYFSKKLLADLAFYFQLFRIDCMAIGGIGALLVFKQPPLLKVIYHPLASSLIFFAAVGLILLPFKIYFFENLICSIIFMALLINITDNARCWYTVENKTMNVLGNISYGIYMYHPLVIFTVIRLLPANPNNLLLYALTLFLSIAVAFLSFKLFEEKLIRFKSKKFTLVKSGA